MALTHHDDIELVAGDDWAIDGVLLDVNGLSLDLTNANFQWTLIDPTGTAVVDVVGYADISITPDNSGQVRIQVPAKATGPLLAGRYHDALRVTINYTSTFWMGTILVDANPFLLLPIFIPARELTSFGIMGGAAGLDAPDLAIL